MCLSWLHKSSTTAKSQSNNTVPDDITSPQPKEEISEPYSTPSNNLRPLSELVAEQKRNRKWYHYRPGDNGGLDAVGNV
ncbi:uncharacterized protein N7483_013014 [Penicillium malachiteum]|uniref:uncharacterized protein n=1 Tax=Penicillium malachiteum TaxID=1324776 RepID=UPI002547B037|nr:uncharacterized protein N7483_013014 [Penicillium malachiteum]KAJ5715833.1 hypothetical protein N7483_013014 [Penicillium malachiteum]